MCPWLLFPPVVIFGQAQLDAELQYGVIVPLPKYELALFYIFPICGYVSLDVALK